MTAELAVVVPTNRPATVVARCLEAVLAQDGPPLEVAIVDDGSPDPNGLARLARPAVSVLRGPGGVSAARNAGVAATSAPVVAFTDDDCLPEPGWTAALLEALDGRDGVVAVGRVVNGVPDNRYAEAVQLVHDLVHSYYDGAHGRPALAAANNLAVPRGLLERVGGFDESMRFAEDRELCARLEAAGATFVPAPTAVVRHEKRLDANGYVRQFFGYGRGSCRFHLGSDGRAARRTAGFYRSLPAAVRGQPPRTLALLALWQAANAAGFAYEAAARAASRVRG